MIVFSYKFHFFHAIGTFIILKLFFIPTLGLWALIGTLIGFKIPDIDSVNSIPNKIFVVTKYISRFFKHRGFLHTIPSLLLFAFLFSILEDKLGISWLSIGVTIGYFSHLLADFTTKQGIKIFWPIKKFYKLYFGKENLAICIWIAIFIILIFIKLDQLRLS